MRFEDADEITYEMAEIQQKIIRIKSKNVKSRRDLENLEVLQMELTHLRRLR